MVNDRLVCFLETNDIMTEYQSGFRKNRSTIDQIIRLESAVRESFIKWEHMELVIFCYLEKHTILLGSMALSETSMMHGWEARSHYLYATFQQVVIQIGNTISDFYDQEERVPQGSILSMTLFSMKTLHSKTFVTRHQLFTLCWWFCHILQVQAYTHN